MRTLLLASTAALIGAGAAQAATVNVTLEQAPPSDQQTEQTYCIIGDPSCNAIGALPGGFTTLPSNVPGYDAIQSPTYDVGQIRGVLSTDVFSVGIDINQADDPQTLSFFGMYLDDDGDDHNDDDDSDTLLYAYDPGSAVEVPDVNNGNGFTDYFLNEFSLEGLADDENIYFVATMPLVNNGREQFYIVDTGTIDPIPLPASAFLLLGGLGGLGLFGRIRKKAA